MAQGKQMGNDNPAAEIVSVIQSIARDNRAQMGLRGKILSPPPEIQISYNGIILDKEDIWINEQLLVGYRREARGHIVSGTQPETCHATHAHGINNEYTNDIVYTDTLKAGDYVAMQRIEGTQQYYVLCKVVKL